jgi:hypothetical protein
VQDAPLAAAVLRHCAGQADRLAAVETELRANDSRPGELTGNGHNIAAGWIRQRQRCTINGAVPYPESSHEKHVCEIFPSTIAAVHSLNKRAIKQEHPQPHTLKPLKA